MNRYRADLHIHTLLSPCGDLEMSPANIVQLAADRKIDILGISDHNSTRHAPLIKQLAEEKGIMVLCGAEVTTKEEVHCLTFFEYLDALADFQQYLETHIAKVKNDTKYFGHQVVIDQEEMIVEEVDYLLISALNQSLDQVEQKVHSLNGLFIPAHIDRPKFSLTSQLGFVPPDIKADALEISRHTTKEETLKKFPYLNDYSFISSSDAHFPEQLGSMYTVFEMHDKSFSEIRKTLKSEEGRRVWIERGELI